MSRERQHGFRDPRSLTRWVTYMLYAQVAISVVALGSGLLEYQLLSGIRDGTFPSQQAASIAAQASDQRQTMVGIVQLVLFIVSGFLILRWIHRAAGNARQLGATDMTFTPGWAIGWYFVPFANLVKPYQAMKEIWQASSQPSHWQDRSVPSLLPWWWFFWLASGLLGNAALQLTRRAEHVDQFITANLLTVLSDATAIPLALVFLAMVRRIHAMQMARATADLPDPARQPEGELNT